jgi:hypothetical protein
MPALTESDLLIRFARCPGRSAGPQIGFDIVALGMPADDAGPRHEALIHPTRPNLPVTGSSLLSASARPLFGSRGSISPRRHRFRQRHAGAYLLERGNLDWKRDDVTELKPDGMIHS